MEEKEIILSDKKQIIDTIKQNEMNALIKPLLNQIHLFDTYISGTSRIKDQSLIANLKIDDELGLKREDSKFDSNGIIVINGEKQKIGYIPEQDNIIFARLMDAGKMLMAKIKSIDGRSDFMKIGIGIYLVDF